MSGRQLVEFVNIKQDGTRYWNGNRIAFDDPVLDTFGNQRVSQAVSLMDSQLQYGDQPLTWLSKITNTSGNAAVTHLPNESSMELSVEAEDTITRQNWRYNHYQPGKTQKIVTTFIMGTAVSGVTRRVGYFDGQNGIFLEQQGTTVNVVLRSFVTGVMTETRVAQADWLLDKYTNLDITARQIFVIDLQWLGTGDVWVGFMDGRRIRYVHVFENINSGSAVYMTTANLPVRYEISAAAGVAGAHTMKQICAQVASEGGFEIERAAIFDAANGTTTRSVTTALPVLSIRPKTTFNAIVNRSLIIPENFSVVSFDEIVFYRIIFGGTLTNPSWVDVNATYSAVEYDVSATAIAGGIAGPSGYVVASGVGSVVTPGQSLSGFLSRLPIALDIDGNHPTAPLTDVVSIVATSLGGATAVAGVVNWREVK